MLRLKLSPSLECSSDRKSESIAFARQEYAWQLFGEAEIRIRIVIVDQTKWNVNDRNLDTKFNTNARLVIFQFIKLRIIDVEL